MCSVLACIPEELLLSRADGGGNSLGSFLPPGTRRGHCVCPGQPGVSSQQLPRASRFLSRPLPFPEPPLTAAAPLGEAREPGRKGSCPGLGWDVFLPATVPEIHPPLDLRPTHPLAPGTRASPAPSGNTECQGSRGDGAGPASAPDPARAPRAALSHTQGQERAGASIPSRTFWGHAGRGAPTGEDPHSARLQGWGHGGRAHPHLPGGRCDHKRARESHRLPLHSCHLLPTTPQPPGHSRREGTICPTGTRGFLSPPAVPNCCWELSFSAAASLQSCSGGSGSTRTLDGARS